MKGSIIADQATLAICFTRLRQSQSWHLVNGMLGWPRRDTWGKLWWDVWGVPCRDQNEESSAGVWGEPYRGVWWEFSRDVWGEPSEAFCVAVTSNQGAHVELLKKQASISKQSDSNEWHRQKSVRNTPVERSRAISTTLSKFWKVSIPEMVYL